MKGDFYVFKGRGRGTLIGHHHGSTAGDLAQSAQEDVAYDSSEPADKASSGKSSSRSRFHKVRRGETLSSIARKHGTTVAALCRINGLTKRSKLRAGQVIKYS